MTRTLVGGVDRNGRAVVRWAPVSPRRPPLRRAGLTGAYVFGRFPNRPAA